MYHPSILWIPSIHTLHAHTLHCKALHCKALHFDGPLLLWTRLMMAAYDGSCCHSINGSSLAVVVGVISFARRASVACFFCVDLLFLLGEGRNTYTVDPLVSRRGIRSHMCLCLWVAFHALLVVSKMSTCLSASDVHPAP